MNCGVCLVGKGRHIVLDLYVIRIICGPSRLKDYLLGKELKPSGSPVFLDGRVTHGMPTLRCLCTGVVRSLVRGQIKHHVGVGRCCGRNGTVCTDS